MNVQDNHKIAFGLLHNICFILLIYLFVFMLSDVCHAQIPFSHQIQMPTGNESFPSITVDGDSDTGIFGDGAGSLGIVNDGYLSALFQNNGSLFVSGGYLESKMSIPGSDANVISSGYSNTPGSDARIYASVAGSSAGDPYFYSVVQGVGCWSWGIDNSDSDKWVLSNAFDLGTAENRAIVIDSNHNISIPNGHLSVNGAAVADDFYLTGGYPISEMGFNWHENPMIFGVKDFMSFADEKATITCNDGTVVPGSIENVFDNSMSASVGSITSTNDTVIIEIDFNTSIPNWAGDGFLSFGWAFLNHVHPRNVTIEVDRNDDGIYDVICSRSDFATGVGRSGRFRLGSPWSIAKAKYTFTNWNTTGAFYLSRLSGWGTNQEMLPGYASISDPCFYGNVGIGTFSPTSKLQVAGSIQGSSITATTGMEAPYYTTTSTAKIKRNIKSLDGKKITKFTRKDEPVIRAYQFDPEAFKPRLEQFEDITIKREEEVVVLESAEDQYLDELKEWEKKKESIHFTRSRKGFIVEEMPEELLSDDGHGWDNQAMIVHLLQRIQALEERIKELESR